MKPDLSPESIRGMLEIAAHAVSATRGLPAREAFRVTFDPALVVALLEEIVRLRERLAPKKPSGLMAALCKDVERAQKEGERRQRLAAHRNRALPQDPPEKT